MTRRLRIVVLWLSGSAVVLSLIGLTLTSRSDWSTFVPDLWLGLLTAGAIGGAISATQHRATLRLAEATDISSAFIGVLEALAPLRGIDPATEPLGDKLSVLSTRMVILADVAAREYPNLGLWLEANRQFALYQLKKTMEARDALPAEATPQDVIEALAPFGLWTRSFGDNLRFWRFGNLSDAELRRDGERIKKIVVDVGAWKDRGPESVR